MDRSDERIHVGLTNEVLDLNEAFNFINSDDFGGNSLFVGTTRGYEEDPQKGRLPIRGLLYEAYESMALKQMRQIVEETMSSNEEVKRCYVVHRLGMVRAGEASILIATSSRGREACSRETMNILCRIKEQVPVWKKIVHSDASSSGGQNRKDEAESEGSSESQTVSNGQLQTNWMMKSEAFWLKK